MHVIAVRCVGSPHLWNANGFSWGCFVAHVTSVTGMTCDVGHICDGVKELWFVHLVFEEPILS